MDPGRHVPLVATSEAEKTDQESASDPADFRSVGRLPVRQEQNWEKDIEVGDKGSAVLLQLLYFAGEQGEILRASFGGISHFLQGLEDLEEVESPMMGLRPFHTWLL